MKHLLKKTNLFIPVLFLLVSSTMLSCKKDKDKTPSRTHTVVYKAQAMNGAELKIAIYGYGTTHLTKNISGTSWTSEETTVNEASQSVQVGVTCDPKDNANAQVKIQIIVDGTVVKELTNGMAGVGLSAQVVYFFANPNG